MADWNETETAATLEEGRPLPDLPEPTTPDWSRIAQKTVPAAFQVESSEETFEDSEDSEEEEEEEEPDEETRLRKEVDRLRAEVNVLRRRKKQRTTPGFKAGSPQIRYVMRSLQACYDVQYAALQTYTDDAPGHPAREMLSRLLKNFMVQLNEESEIGGFDWKAAPDRPHAKKIKFIV